MDRCGCSRHGYRLRFPFHLLSSFVAGFGYVSVVHYAIYPHSDELKDMRIYVEAIPRFSPGLPQAIGSQNIYVVISCTWLPAGFYRVTQVLQRNILHPIAASDPDLIHPGADAYQQKRRTGFEQRENSFSMGCLHIEENTVRFYVLELPRLERQ